MKMISIIVIEYNSVNEILQCVESVRSYCNDVDYELIVSSNSCYSKEYQIQLLSEIPDVKWSFNEINGGFAYGMNQGLKMSNGDYLVILNPDVEIKGSLKLLTDFLSSHKDVGGIAPQIIGHDGALQDSCRKFVTPWRFFRRQLYRKLTNNVSILSSNFDYTKVQTVDCVIGAFIMVSRELYNKIGGLDETYFMYAEDIDWCTRIWEAGYKVVYYPQLQIVYEGSRRPERARNTQRYSSRATSSIGISLGGFGDIQRLKKFTIDPI